MHALKKFYCGQTSMQKHFKQQIMYLSFLYGVFKLLVLIVCGQELTQVTPILEEHRSEHQSTRVRYHVLEMSKDKK